jgi:hypothetical protein
MTSAAGTMAQNNSSYWDNGKTATERQQPLLGQQQEQQQQQRTKQLLEQQQRQQNNNHRSRKGAVARSARPAVATDTARASAKDLAGTRCGREIRPSYC